ncbi:Beta-hexosaminidase, eukaryotic type, N-terminal [Dillenia turbinata]|uniref:Beta-hexosaminidase n=1 Tax=Dillenia turbinata TaxID=194707 RepID=A0AAN8YWN9_9MAGN
MELGGPRCAGLVLLLLLISCGQGRGADPINIWPMPKSVTSGKQTLLLSNDFVLNTQGSKYPDSSGILKDGFSRFLQVLRASHVADSNSSYSSAHFPVCKGLHVVILSPNDKLQYGVDESYKLSVTALGAVYAYLEANTVYGALHGLQTFSQLCHFNFKARVFEVRQAPWTIIDQPRFSYRGLLIDTSRHYQPLIMIKNVIDSMAYTKLNVLHWHIVDTQSFPLEIPSYPKLYAQTRGINVLAEIDVPGHTQSWGIGYPSLWPSTDCQQPLDVSNELTFKVIDGILSDFSKVFNYNFVHLGGDEVNTNLCWLGSHYELLKKKGLNESEAYQYFVLRSQEIALSHGYDIVNWEETFNNFGSKLSRKTVVHNWIGSGVAERVVAAGLRCIVSNQDKWYLHYLDTTWQEFYMNEPLTNITNPKQQELVIGGEVCMWGEYIDGSDIEQTIWPRAAAAAERLWTPYDKLAKDPRRVTGRLAHFRCLLNERGVPAAPLNGPGRVAPEEPGSCYKQ